MKWIALLFIGAILACSTRPLVIDEQTRGAIKQLTDAIAQQPTNMPWIYVLATYYDRAHDKGEVVRLLTRLDELGWQHGLNIHDFRHSFSPQFRNVWYRLRARVPRVNNAQTAFALEDQCDLIPEGIVYDRVDDVFYVSGIYRRKVLRVTRDGRFTEFVKEAQDGMLGGLGMDIDQRRRHLWVISSTTKEMRGYVKGQEASLLAAYDLRDGSLVKKLDPAPARLNDLTILEDGTIFATDMAGHTVVRLAPGADKFETYLDGLAFPNGITNDGTNLYVADFRGLHRIAFADKSRTKIEIPNAFLGGIDGLEFHQGTLIGIQNAVGAPQVIRIHLDSNRLELLEANNSSLEVPTTGAIAGGAFYFIANPGLRSFYDNGRIHRRSWLDDPVMLKIAL